MKFRFIVAAAAALILVPATGAVAQTAIFQNSLWWFGAPPAPPTTPALAQQQFLDAFNLWRLAKQRGETGAAEEVDARRLGRLYLDQVYADALGAGRDAEAAVRAAAANYPILADVITQVVQNNRSERLVQFVTTTLTAPATGIQTQVSPFKPTP